MNHPTPPSRQPDPSPSPEGQSIIEGAIRRSLRSPDEIVKTGSGPFREEDHLAVARSGAADLSRDERGELFQQLADNGPLPYGTDRTPKPVPLFFGSWTGMNPFRLLKPFFIQKKRDGR
jgi:hypothetical protein